MIKFGSSPSSGRTWGRSPTREIPGPPRCCRTVHGQSGGRRLVKAITAISMSSLLIERMGRTDVKPGDISAVYSSNFGLLGGVNSIAETAIISHWLLPLFVTETVLFSSIHSSHRELSVSPAAPVLGSQPVTCYLVTYHWSQHPPLLAELARHRRWAKTAISRLTFMTEKKTNCERTTHCKGHFSFFLKTFYFFRQDI